MYLTCFRSVAECLTVQYPSSSALICSGGKTLPLGTLSGSTYAGDSLFSLSGIWWGGLAGRGFLALGTLNLSSVKGADWFGCGCSGDLLVMTSEVVVSSVLLEGKRFSLELRGVARGVSYG